MKKISIFLFVILIGCHKDTAKIPTSKLFEISKFNGDIVRTTSAIINLNSVSNKSIRNLDISGGSSACITLTNCSYDTITYCKLHNSTGVGIYLYNCSHIYIRYNYFTVVASGVYADHCGNNIQITTNQFLNMQGPFPRGQFVQFNNVIGAGSYIISNKCENISGQSNAEDGISIYQSNGTSASPIEIIGNWIRGGGPSSSGGGIMLGDQGGSYATASNNILVNPGEYGMAITGGYDEVLSDNIVFGASQSFTNVGIYVDNIGGYITSDCYVVSNKVNFFNSNGYSNPAWLDGSTAKPNGWDGNFWADAAINANALPATIITFK